MNIAQHENERYICFCERHGIDISGIKGTHYIKKKVDEFLQLHRSFSKEKIAEVYKNIILDYFWNPPCIQSAFFFTKHVDIHNIKNVDLDPELFLIVTQRYLPPKSTIETFILSRNAKDTYNNRELRHLPNSQRINSLILIQDNQDHWDAWNIILDSMMSGGGESFAEIILKQILSIADWWLWWVNVPILCFVIRRTNMNQQFIDQITLYCARNDPGHKRVADTVSEKVIGGFSVNNLCFGFEVLDFRHKLLVYWLVENAIAGDTIHDPNIIRLIVQLILALR